jgi:hypothetical protein
LALGAANGLVGVRFLRIASLLPGSHNQHTSESARHQLSPSPGGCMCARRVSLAIVLLTALTLGGAGSAGAQSSAPAAWQATPASVLKGALRAATTAQERYLAANGTYAASVERLDLRPDAGVRVDILRASASGWQGKATYRGQPGRSCVVFVGSLEGIEAPRTDGDREMAGEEGIPLCDRMR